MTVIPDETPMVIRVLTGEQTQNWLIPGWGELPPDRTVVLASQVRPAGPIELVDPADRRVVASAIPATSGPGILVVYWFDGDPEQWVLRADVDTMLEHPTAALPSDGACASDVVE